MTLRINPPQRERQGRLGGGSGRTMLQILASSKSSSAPIPVASPEPTPVPTPVASKVVPIDKMKLLELGRTQLFVRTSSTARRNRRHRAWHHRWLEVERRLHSLEGPNRLDEENQRLRAENERLREQNAHYEVCLKMHTQGGARPKWGANAAQHGDETRSFGADAEEGLEEEQEARGFSSEFREWTVGKFGRRPPNLPPPPVPPADDLANEAYLVRITRTPISAKVSVHGGGIEAKAAETKGAVLIDSQQTLKEMSMESGLSSAQTQASRGARTMGTQMRLRISTGTSLGWGTTRRSEQAEPD